MPRRQRNRLQHRKVILGLLAALCTALCYGVLIGDQGISSYLSLRETLHARAGQAQNRIERNRELQHDLEGIRSGSRVLEEVARSKLGVVGSDEIVYVFRDNEPRAGERRDTTSR